MPCIHYGMEVPRVDLIPDPTVRIPWPVCLSCPDLLDRDILQKIYPERFKRVEQLIQQYGIADYVQSVDKLSALYRVGEFEKAMFELEREGIKPLDLMPGLGDAPAVIKPGLDLGIGGALR